MTSFPIRRAPRVWVVNFTGHNYHKALEWGELVPITEGSFPIDNFDRLLGLVTAKLRDSQPHDFVLLSGYMVLNFIVGAVWIKMHGNLRALVWTRSRYHELKASADQIDFLLSFNPAESHAARLP